MPQLIITQRGSTDKRSVSCQDPDITIGRQAGNEVVLVHESISRHHAKVMQEGEEFFLVDLGSDNGTMLNNAPIKKHERYLLRANDIIMIDGYNLHFSREQELEQSLNEVTDSEVLEVKLLKKVLHALDKETLPSLEVLNESAEGKKFLLADDLEELIIGREAEATFQIEEYVVSRRHAAVMQHEDGITVKDLGSKNGTFVNGVRVQEAALHDGDRLGLGTIVCIFRNPKEVSVEAIQSEVNRMRPKPPPPQEPAEADDADAEANDIGDDAEDATQAASTVDPLSAEEVAAREAAHAYPAPKARRSWISRLSPMEIGLMWGSFLVFVATVVMLFRLIF